MPLYDFPLYSHCDYAASARMSGGKGALRVHKFARSKFGQAKPVPKGEPQGGGEQIRS
jgi:hypothetical protein